MNGLLGFSGTRLRESRVSLGLSPRELALKVGVSRVTIRNWEIGYYQPKADYLPKLSCAVGQPMEHFYVAPHAEG